MKAMIFAAGLGTRLMPYTSKKPKALIKLNGIPLLEILIKKLIDHGITDIVVNVHHFADEVIRFLNRNDFFGIHIEISDERDHLLDTGGGIMKASRFFRGEDHFLVHNVDVISDIDLNRLISIHQSGDSLTTLAVRNRKSSRYLLFDKDLALCGWQNLKTGESVLTGKKKVEHRLAFSGIHVIDCRIFDLTERQGKFSIIETYLELAGEYVIRGFIHDESTWFDVGSPQQLKTAEKYLKLQDESC